MSSYLTNPYHLRAKAMAKLGFAVIPLYEPRGDGCSCGDSNCTHIGKHPRTRHGVRDATDDLAQIERWWSRSPEANIGIATGAKSGIFVLDIDGDEGRATLADLMRGHGPISDAAKVSTGRGEHYYFRWDDSLHVWNGRLGPGIDLRGDGGYVVGMGSRHASGSMYRPGRWGQVRPKFRPATPPDWLREALTTHLTRPFSGRPVNNEAEPRHYGVAAIEAEVNKVRQACRGTRNSTLNTAAFKLGQLVPSGHVNPTVVVERLLAAAKQNGFQQKEAAATIRSGLTAGQREPRWLAAAATASPLTEPITPEVAVDPLAQELALLDETDVGNAERLVRRFGDRLLCTPGLGFLVYDGTRWRRDDHLRRMGYGEQTAAHIASEARHLEREADRAGRARFSKNSQSKSALDRMFDVSRSRLMREDSLLDADPYLLNAENGIIDLRTGKLRPHDASDLQTKLLSVRYEPEAGCPLFLTFLESALRGDAELLAFVKKAVGYSLTGSTSEQVFFFLHGPGSTGKSTFINLIRDLLGDYGTHTPSETLLSKQYDSGIPADLARLQSVRMVTAVEVNWNRQIDEAKLKAMTGGDPITARFLRQNFFTFVPEFKLWMAANDLPGVRGTAEAFWRRVRVVPFTVQVSKESGDSDLPTKLRAELPGILAWAVQGCLAWQREGLTAPEAVQQATEGWVRKADHLVKFAADEFIRDTSCLIGAHDCYERYKAWCAKHGETPSDARRLKQGLEGLDYTHARMRSGSVWRGVKLRLAG